jgi:glycerophosphoryl diester phosphodiesterase
MAAFALAMEEGADGVELDVRLDRDGDVIVLHDTNLERVTRGHDARDAEGLGRTELASVDLGNGERVPRLADVLCWARSQGARVNVELKADVPNRAALAVRVAALLAVQPRAADWLIASSFDPRLVAAMARLLPWIPSGWLVEKSSGFPGRSFRERLVGAVAVHPEASLVTAASIAPWKRAGLPVNVWTVNAPHEAARLAGLGVDTLISDEPGKILAAVRQ